MSIPNTPLSPQDATEICNQILDSFIEKVDKQISPQQIENTVITRKQTWENILKIVNEFEEQFSPLIEKYCSETHLSNLNLLINVDEASEDKRQFLRIQEEFIPAIKLFLEMLDEKFKEYQADQEKFEQITSGTQAFIEQGVETIKQEMQVKFESQENSINHTQLEQMVTAELVELIVNLKSHMKVLYSNHGLSEEAYLKSVQDAEDERIQPVNAPDEFISIIYNLTEKYELDISVSGINF